MYVINTPRCEHTFTSTYGRDWECIKMPHPEAPDQHVMTRVGK